MSDWRDESTGKAEVMPDVLNDERLGDCAGREQAAVTKSLRKPNELIRWIGGTILGIFASTQPRLRLMTTNITLITVLQ